MISNILGIFCTGVSKPESNIKGIISKKVNSIACCIFNEIAEIDKPSPTTAILKLTKPKYSSPIEPFIGIWNQNKMINKINYPYYILSTEKAIFALFDSYSYFCPMPPFFGGGWKAIIIHSFHYTLFFLVKHKI